MFYCQMKNECISCNTKACLECGRCIGMCTDWISIKREPPICDLGEEHKTYTLAYHTIFGVGVAWFYKLDEGFVEEMENDFKDKYIISCRFVKNKLDGNYGIDDEDEIDIFQLSPHFSNLGTVTHWMQLPNPP